MDDDARRGNQTQRRPDRRGGPGDRQRPVMSTGNTWFAHNGNDRPGEGGSERPPPGGREPRDRGDRRPDPQASSRQTPEERYASALAALSTMVATFDFEALPWVTEVLRATAGALPEDAPSRPSVLNNLGSAAQLSFVATGDAADLDDAISYYRSAAATAHDDDADVVLYLCNLALALTDSASRGDRPDQAADAVQAARKATRLAERNNPHHTTALVRLANALKLHARIAEDSGSDDESVEAFRNALRASLNSGRQEQRESPDLLINLGSALLRRHERGAASEDLDEGVNHLRSGVGMLPDSEQRRTALLHFAEALRLRFRQRGDLADLQAAIDELRGVIDDLTSGSKLLGKALWNLSSATVEHVECTGEATNLYQTLRAVGPALRSLDADDPERAVAVAAYGALARRHFQHGSNTSALDTAVAAGEAAADAVSTAGRRYAVLNSLSSTLITRYEHAEDPADLERAAEVADEALREAPEGSTPRYTAYAQLGIVSAHRYRSTSNVAELDTAMDLLDRALIAMPETAPERVGVSLHLGRVLQTLYRRTGRRKLYRWARKTLTAAANLPTGPADQRLRAANLCGRLAAQAHRWSEALESFTVAVELLPLVAQGKRAVADATSQRRWAHVTADAAACALEVGQPERAVELLEHGRCAVLSELLPAAGPLGRLHERQPGLATEAVRIRRLLDRPPEEGVLAGPDIVPGAERRRLLTETWDELTAEVRAEGGHEGHLEPEPFTSLAEAAQDGSVVLLNLSRYRSDALIVFAGRTLVVPLPSAAPDIAVEQAETTTAAAQSGAHASEDVADTLDWLWRTVTKPVLDRMGYTRPPEAGQRWPRLWWCAAGPLGFLPLHAAASRSGECVLDRVVSSYTPTLRSLGQAKRREPVTGEPHALVAAGSSAQAARSRELPPQNQTLARHWPSAAVVSTEESTAEEVLEALPRYPLLHVCEPSTQDPAYPAGSLLLDREPDARSLGLVELGQVALPDAEFAYLGACGTTQVPPSEAAVSLAAALGYAGFAHVVSTLWAIESDTAARVHADVTDEVFGEGGIDTDHTGPALHAAAQRLREDHPDEPVLWAAFSHVGP